MAPVLSRRFNFPKRFVAALDTTASLDCECLQSGKVKRRLPISKRLRTARSGGSHGPQITATANLVRVCALRVAVFVGCVALHGTRRFCEGFSDGHARATRLEREFNLQFQRVTPLRVGDIFCCIISSLLGCPLRTMLALTTLLTQHIRVPGSQLPIAFGQTTAAGPQALPSAPSGGQ